MLTYSFDKRGSQSLYEYLYDCLKSDIVHGVLAPNEKLPSKRAFAANHGISIVTVENAYGQLMAEGYIYSKPKSGFYVSPIQSPILTTNVDSDLFQIPQSHPDDNNAINLISNHTAPDNFPFSIWAKLTRQILNEQSSKLLTPPPAGGVPELRTAIARHLHEFRGITASPEQIMIGAGTEYLYGLIVQLLGRDLVYGLENPSSKKIRSIYGALGVKVAPLEMDEEGIRLDAANLADPDIIQISPSHHFPTGIVTSVSRRYGLLQWASKSDSRYIIEDDYDSEFRLQGKPIPSLFSMDTTDKVIYFNTFTKSLASTIRVSYMVLPKSLLHLYYSKLGFYACTVSNFEQYTLAAFIREQYFEKHINRMRNHYRNLRDALITELRQSSLSEKIAISQEHAGLHFLLHINSEKSDAELQACARDEAVTLAFVSDYYSPACQADSTRYAHTAIINYSGLNMEDIPDVIHRLSRAWGDLCD